MKNNTIELLDVLKVPNTVIYTSVSIYFIMLMMFNHDHDHRYNRHQEIMEFWILYDTSKWFAIFVFVSFLYRKQSWVFILLFNILLILWTYSLIWNAQPDQVEYWNITHEIYSNYYIKLFQIHALLVVLYVLIRNKKFFIENKYLASILKLLRSWRE